MGFLPDDLPLLRERGWRKWRRGMVGRRSEEDGAKGVKWLNLWGIYSQENWSRSKEQVELLSNLHWKTGP